VRTSAFVFTAGTNLAFLAWVYRRLANERERRQAANENLERVNQKLQNTIDSISDGLMILDREWRISYLSSQGARVLHVKEGELERLVAELTAKLQELVGALEHVSYTVTHDRRSPLRAVTGFAHVLEDLGAECPEDQRKHFISRISAAARRMDLLITDARNYE